MTNTTCKQCGGDGTFVATRVQYVSRDMASDAGEPDMAGTALYEEELEQCEACQGTGFVEPEKEKTSPEIKSDDAIKVEDVPF